MKKRILKLILLEETLRISWWWLRWLDWHRKKHRGSKVWQTLWAWYVYQVISGYPKGELAHWFEDQPGRRNG